MKKLVLTEGEEYDKIEDLVDFLARLVSISKEDSPRVWAAALLRLHAALYEKLGNSYESYQRACVEAGEFYKFLWDEK